VRLYGGPQGGSGNVPPAPVPPKAPPGIATEYFSTCGGTHPPVSYVFPGPDGYKTDPTTGKKELSDEAKKYFDSKEYKDYKKEVDKYKRDNTAAPGTYGNADGDEATPGTPTLGTGIQVRKLDRSAKQDLTNWLSGTNYHDPVAAITYEQPAPELSASLEDPLQGPALSASYYGKLASWMSSEAQAATPSPQELVANVEGLWELHWRRNLSFDVDASAQRLTKDLERAATTTKSVTTRLENLEKRGAADEMTRLQVHDQRATLSKELKEAQAQEVILRGELERRMDFVRAMVSLLRLAPDGGYGPTFHEFADVKGVQSAAAKILGQIGGLAAGEIWKGLAEDTLWLSASDKQAVNDSARRVQAVAAAQSALADPRIDGVTAVCAYLQSKVPTSSVSTLKALELFDTLGTKMVRPETLATLPDLLVLCKHKHPEVAAKARWVLLRYLSVKGGKASLENALGTLAPLIGNSDTELSDATHAFLTTHTGQKTEKNAQAWLELRKRMVERREAAKPAP